jgi:hypothetical protein
MPRLRRFKVSMFATPLSTSIAAGEGSSPNGEDAATALGATAPRWRDNAPMFSRIRQAIPAMSYA